MNVAVPDPAQASEPEAKAPATLSPGVQGFLEMTLVFFGGFTIMVLEIAGARYLPKYFGSSFYVWVSQIGMIMAALAVGYYLGGRLADRFERPAAMGWLLALAGLFTFFVFDFAPTLLGAIVNRHPLDQDIPIIWQKLDPAFGSAVLFLPPCFVLAMLSPFTIRLGARQLERVGSISGRVAAASTLGSIVGVFACGYALLDWFELPTVFRGMGLLTLMLGGLCYVMTPGAKRRWLAALGCFVIQVVAWLLSSLHSPTAGTANAGWALALIPSSFGGLFAIVSVLAAEKQRGLAWLALVLNWLGSAVLAFL